MRSTLLFLLALATPLGAQTHQDSLDARYVKAKIDTLQTANGVGNRRNLADAARARVAGWLARVDGIVDTITITRTRVDTLIRVDTIRVPIDTTTPTNKAPVAGLRAVCDTLRKCVATSTSTDDKGVTGYAWQWGDGSVSTATGSAQHTYAAFGIYTVTLTVRDAEGLTGTATQTVSLSAPIVITDSTPPANCGSQVTDTARFAGAAELPRVTPCFVVPAPTRSYVVSGNLQAALDTAKAGDELRLKPGTYPGQLRWPQVCTMGKWLTLRTDGVTDAPYATAADTSRYARIVTTTSEWALRIDGPVCNVQLRSLAFIVTDAPSINYGVVWLGNGGWVAGGELQTTLASVPQNVLLDHVVITGTTNANTTRCLALNSGATVVTHSWFSGCHADGFDAQAIATWNGPGPWLIEDSYLEASGENFIAGGADAGIPGLIPSDITFRKVHFYKPLSWKGSRWSIKNLFELKNAQRVLVESSVFQNSWPDEQEGWAAILASINQGGTVAGSYATVRDVTIRWNTFDAVNHAIAVAPANNYAGAGATPARNITVSDNRWTNVTDKTFLVNGGMSGVTFARNTSGPSRAWFQIGSQSSADRFPGLTIQGNRAGTAVYAINSPNGDNEALFAAYGIPLTSFVGNCLALTADQVPYLTSTRLPGNTFVSAQTACPASAGVNPTELASRIAGVQRTTVTTAPLALRSAPAPSRHKPLPAPKNALERGRRARQVVGSGGVLK